MHRFPTTIVIFTCMSWLSVVSGGEPKLETQPQEWQGGVDPDCYTEDGLEQLQARLHPSKAVLQAWLDSLGHEDFAEREAASKALEKHGFEVLPELERLATSSNAEISARTQKLLVLVDPKRQPKVTQEQLIEQDRGVEQRLMFKLRFRRSDGVELGGPEVRVFGDWSVYDAGTIGQEVFYYAPGDDSCPKPGKVSAFALGLSDGGAPYWFGPCKVDLPENWKGHPVRATMIMEPFDLAEELDAQGNPKTPKARARVNAVAQYFALARYIETKAIPALAVPLWVNVLRKRADRGEANALAALLYLGAPIPPDEVERRLKGTPDLDLKRFVNQLLTTDPNRYVELAKAQLNGELVHDVQYLRVLIAAGVPAPPTLTAYAGAKYHNADDNNGIYDPAPPATVLLAYCTRFRQNIPDAFLHDMLTAERDFIEPRRLEQVAKMLTLAQQKWVSQTSQDGPNELAKFYCKALLYFAGDETLLPDLLSKVPEDFVAGGTYYPNDDVSHFRLIVEYLIARGKAPERLRAAYKKYLLFEHYDFMGSGNAAQQFMRHPLPEFAEYITTRLADPPDKEFPNKCQLISGLTRLNYKPALEKVGELMVNWPAKSDYYWGACEMMNLNAEPAQGPVIEREMHRLSDMKEESYYCPKAKLVGALGRLGARYPLGVALLQDTASKASRFSDLRLITLLSLVQSGRTETLQELKKELLDAPLRRKATLITVISHTDHPDFCAVLKPYLDHPNAQIRCSAAVALMRLGDPSGISVLYMNRFAFLWSVELRILLLRFWQKDTRPDDVNMIRECLAYSKDCPTDTPREYFEKEKDVDTFWRNSPVEQSPRFKD